MDRLGEYRRVIKQTLSNHARLQFSQGQIERLAICDERQDQYFLLDVGWDKRGRVYRVVFHVRIRDGKIWVEEDWTEYGVAGEFADAGIPKDDIVLAFHPPEKRRLTEFAMA